MLCYALLCVAARGYGRVRKGGAMQSVAGSLRGERTDGRM